MTIGEMLAFVGMMGMLYHPVNHLTSVATAVQAALVVLRRVFAVLDEPEEVPPGRISLDGMAGKIEFDRVTYIYPKQETPALDDVDFRISPGQTVALMGPSGSGKTTVFQLLLRFYDPQGGHVRVGGVDLVEADPASIRRHIRVVQQEPTVFSGTISDNIRYGKLDASDDEIRGAATQAELHDFIGELPLAYNTIVGENGVTLSGGQKQRLALATALLTDPEVLLLDDTTSALDAATEARIRRTLRHALAGRTSLIITQRIATARQCDRILVFEDGRITQRGTHEELKQAPGFYAHICREQEEA
jgi:ABC-type multidrug transport system fused ATPase/permease subunit